MKNRYTFAYQLTIKHITTMANFTDITELRDYVVLFLKENLPSEIFVEVKVRGNFFSDGKYLQIKIYSSQKPINGVNGQYPDIISMMLEENLLLSFQGFGGNGGRALYRSIDKENPKERFLALCHENIKFRTPKLEEKAVFIALKNVCLRYVEMLQNFKDRGLLISYEGSDYSFLK